MVRSHSGTSSLLVPTNPTSDSFANVRSTKSRSSPRAGKKVQTRKPVSKVHPTGAKPWVYKSAVAGRVQVHQRFDVRTGDFTEHGALLNCQQGRGEAVRSVHGMAEPSQRDRF